MERAADLREAERFIRLFHAEHPTDGGMHARLRDVARDITRHGTYAHTFEELQFGARVAWRNSNRCIGRLYWQSLRVRDRRDVTGAEGVALECVAHLREATGDGRIRPTITVFPPDRPGHPAPRVLNEQLIRYAGHRTRKGSIIGDPRQIEFTAMARGLGWHGGLGRFDVLPLIIDPGRGEPLLCNLPGDAVLEVPITHPVYSWFADLGLRWHAVPAISGMCLEIGGVCYPCAPFNGWYMGAEIGARNLADTDRYDQLPVVAERLGLDHRALALARPRAGGAERGGAALLRGGGRDDDGPPHGVRPVPDSSGARGEGGPHLPRGVVVDRPAHLGRRDPRLPPLLRQSHPHPHFHAAPLTLRPRPPRTPQQATDLASPS
jgi:nitric-oxide synthase